MPEVVYLNHSDFRKSMLALRRRGGPYQLAYQTACSIIESLRLGADVSNKITNHGENRIDHAVKYDIGHGCRLVTIQTENFIYLIYVGTHEDADRWILKNAGLVITANATTREVIVTHITKQDPEARRPLPNLDESRISEQNTPFLLRIPGFDVAECVAEPYLVRQLQKIDEETTDEEVLDLLNLIAQKDPDAGNLLFDLLAELREGNIEGATARLETRKGTAVPVEENSSLENDSVNDTTNSQRLVNLSGMSKEDVERLFSPDGFRDWMLFLHPDQKKIAEADYDKPTVLTGVSGSGKTVILVHRARYLARKYRGERIGVITLSRSLAKLISNQLDELCKPDVRKQIHVHAFYDYFKSLVDAFGPGDYLEQLKAAAKGHDYEEEIVSTISAVKPETFAREYDPLSKEDLGDTWEIFLEQPGIQTCYTYFRTYVEKHQWNIDAKTYLQEELSLVRSAFATVARKSDYRNLARTGRAIALSEDARKWVLDLLALYEETMLHGGILDVLSLTSAVLPHVTRIRDLPPEKRFRCLLVDEYQDFSTLDLGLLRRIPTNLSENGFFLTGDPVQRVLVKDLRMGAVGLDIISSNRVRIRKNYRNSKQILEAAHLLAKEFGSKAKELGEDLEILDPDLAVRETAPPLVVKTNKDDEIRQAWKIVSDCLENKQALAWSVTICTASPSMLSVHAIEAGKPSSLPVDVKQLSGDYTEDRNTVTIGTMADLKGFEFSLVVIVACGNGFLPSPGRCEEEVWRDALRLYVAMTRARDSAYLIFSGEPSPFLQAMGEKVTWAEANQRDYE